MKTKNKIPMRQFVTGCREMKNKKEMIRVLGHWKIRSFLMRQADRTEERCENMSLLLMPREAITITESSGHPRKWFHRRSTKT